MRPLPLHPIRRFIDQCLRGVGQVMLQNNPLTGLLLLLGIFVSDWASGLCALMATAVATAGARWFGIAESDIDSGLYGFNGTLTGLGLAVYLQHDLALPFYVFVASLFATVVTAALATLCGSRCKPLTGPFVIVTWIFIGGASVHGHLHGSALLAAPHLSSVAMAAGSSPDLADLAIGILNGPSQVMLQENAWAGGIFLLALAVGSRTACIAAILGSTIGAATGLALGATPEALRAGLDGFNAVLTAIATGSVFFRLSRASVVLAALAVATSTILYGSLVAVLAPLGLPALTAPFVIATWLCLLASGSMTRLKATSAARAPRQDPVKAQPAEAGDDQGEAPSTPSLAAPTRPR